MVKRKENIAIWMTAVILVATSMSSCQRKEVVVYEEDPAQTELIENLPRQNTSSTGSSGASSTGTDVRLIPQIQRPSGSSVFHRRLYNQNNLNPHISYCESVGNGQAGYSGFHDLKKEALASVSKVFLAAWVLNKLGPQYKFEHTWHIKPVDPASGVYDAYFESNYDPVVNIEKMLYAMSLLKNRGVNKIRNLVIDESTRVYLSVLGNAHSELNQIPVSSDQSIENLNIILNSSKWGRQTAIAKQNLQNYLLQKRSHLSIASTFSVGSVKLIPATQIAVNSYPDKLKYKSSSMLSYLKEINVYSNNYMSDAFFHLLGGYNGFKKFQQEQLGLTAQELEIYTGSGLAITNMGYRTDNKGSCYSVLKVLRYLDLLSQKFNFNLGQILLTAGLDSQGTYTSQRNMSFNQNLVLKTGRLYDVPTLNVAGIAATSQGKIYFMYMAHNFNNNHETTYKNLRDDFINDLFNYYSAQRLFNTQNQKNVFLD